MSTPNEQQPRTLEEAESVVAIYDALTNLRKSKDFQLVFEKHLFTDEVLRLHSLLAHPDAAIVESRDMIIKDLDALSNVKFALQLINQIGQSTKTQLGEFRAAQFEAENPEVGE